MAAYAERLFDGPLPWAKLRQGHKLIRLGERYSPERLDAACRRALSVDLIDVRRLERILVEALEQEATQPEPPPMPSGRFARPGAVFARANGRTAQSAQGRTLMTTTTELTPLLKRLKLGAVLNTLPERVALARREQLDYASFLQIILTDEINRRDHRRLELRLQRAGFEQTCRLEDFDWSASITLDRRLLDAAFSLQFLDRNEHVLLVGPVGVGQELHRSGPRICCRQSRAYRPLRTCRRLLQGHGSGQGGPLHGQDLPLLSRPRTCSSSTTSVSTG